MGCGASTPGTVAIAASVVTELSEPPKQAKGAGTKAPAPGAAQPTLTSAAKAVATSVPRDADDLAAVEDKARAAEELLEGLGSGDEAAMEELGAQAGEALNAIDGIVSLFNKVTSSAKAASGAAPDVQDLAARPLSKAEKALVKYSALGQIAVDVACQGLSALPFGAPVAALLGAIYGRTVQTAKNSRNCQLLVAQIKRCDKQLARVAVLMSGKGGGGSGDTKPIASDVLSGLEGITRVLKKSAALISTYSDRGCVMRFVSSTGDQQAFKALETELNSSMQWTSFAMSIELLAQPQQYVDESAALRKAICAAAGLPESQAKEALEQLCQKQPDKLRELLKEHGSFSDQVLMQEMDLLSKRLAKVESTVGKLEKSLADQDVTLKLLLDEVQTLKTRVIDGMADWVMEWWNKHVGRRKRSIKWEDFKAKLKASVTEIITGCDSDLLEEASELGVDLKAVVGSEDVFLDVVLRPTVDANGDDAVTDSELKGLMVTGMAYAARVERLNPSDMEELLDMIFLGFDRSLLRVSVKEQAGVEAVTDKLKVKQVIQTYNTAALLDNYMPGTRKWMFDSMLTWQRAAASQAPDTSRMFLLLAEAGMGKSMCSAVLLSDLASAAGRTGDLVVAHHFFKIGQARGEGRTMLLCLMQQLCERLPGLAALVQASLQHVTDLQALDLPTTFDKVVLGPLQSLDANMQTAGTKPPCCLLLLDALDESDYNNQGYQPTCNLVASSFSQLPPWVCVLVTGRPQVESAFHAWKPQRIEALDARNKDDLRILLEGKLRDQKLVAEGDLKAAVELLLNKSQGQFIYSAYVSQALTQQPCWTLQQLQRLPDGLAAFYAYRLDCIDSALRGERPELVTLLRDRLLPILAVMRQPLSASMLAWLCGQGTVQDVSLLMELLYALFPGRPGPDQGSGPSEEHYAPYHKSVTDFLLGLADNGQEASPGGPPSQWVTSQKAAHALFVSRLLPEVLDPAMRHWQDACAPQVAYGDYGLPHLLDHIAQAQDWSSLHRLVRTLPALKAVLETTGQVYKLIQVLSEAVSTGTTGAHPLSASAVTEMRSVHRFLRASCYLVASAPHQLLQEIACSPQPCALGTWCEEQFDINSVSFWKGATFVPQRAPAFPALVATLQGHRSCVKCCVLSPDGKTVVSGGQDWTLKVWDMATGQLLRTLAGHTSPVSCCAITPDGRTLVSGASDKTVKMWEMASGQPLKTLEGHENTVSCCAITPDGKALVSGSHDKTLKVWDMATGQLVRSLVAPDEQACCAISPDGITLVSSGRDTKLLMWEVATGELTRTLEGHMDGVSCCAFTPDGKTLVSGAIFGTIKVWDTATGQVLRTWEQPGTGSDNTITSDGKTLVSTCSRDILVWDIASGNLLKRFEGHTQNAYCCAVTPDGKTLVSGANDKTIKVWDMSAGALESVTEGHASKVTCCALSPDDTTLVTGACENTLKVWDTASGQVLRTLGGDGKPQSVYCCTISGDGKTIVSGSADDLKVWDMASGQLLKTLPDLASSTCCALSPDGKILALGFRGQFTQVWDLATEGETHLRSVEAHSHETSCCVFSPDGKTLVSGGADKTLKMWEVATGELLRTFEGHKDRVKCCAITPDGKTLVSGSDDKTLKVWDLATGQVLRTLEGHVSHVKCCALSADGSTLVSGAWDCAFKVWDMATGTLLQTLMGTISVATCCAVSRDGTTVIAGTESKALKVWELAGSRPTGVLGFHYHSGFYAWYPQPLLRLRIVG